MRACILQYRRAPGAVECWAEADEDTLRPQRVPRRLVLSQCMPVADWRTARVALVERERAMLARRQCAKEETREGDELVHRTLSVCYSICFFHESGYERIRTSPGAHPVPISRAITVILETGNNSVESLRRTLKTFKSGNGCSKSLFRDAQPVTVVS